MESDGTKKGCWSISGSQNELGCHLGLDVLTQRGQESVRQEAHAVSLLCAKHPSYSYLHTPKHLPADVDAVLLKDGVIDSIVETKCRDCTLEQFMGAFKGQWLVTFDKVIKARDIATRMGVSLTGFLYRAKSDVLLIQRITLPDGTFIPRMVVETTETQRTINGGKAIRTNAYIDMQAAKQIRAGQ